MSQERKQKQLPTLKQDPPTLNLNEDNFGRGMYKSQSAADFRNKGANRATPQGNDAVHFFSGRASQQSQMKLKPNSLAALSIYTGGFSQTLSANTLQNSHSAWSFPKADRFVKILVDNNAKMQLLPSTLEKTKFTSFGFGEKQGVQCRLGTESPPPNTYKLRGQFDLLRNNTGKSFGLPHSAYSKVYIENNKYSTSVQEAPGPGTYDLKGLVGVNALKFSLKSRVKAADSATRENPPSNTYHPNFALTEQAKYGAITFGFGNRCNVTGQIKETPGPGTYKIPSVFDKFKRLPAKQYFLLKEQGGLHPNNRLKNGEEKDLEIQE